MKKIFLILIAIVIPCLETYSQTSKGVMDFLRSCKYEIIVGYNTNVSTEPFSEAKIGYNLGITGRKEIATLKDDKIGVYGIVGLILTKRGGKIDNDFMTLLDDNKNLSISALSVPMHVGGEYKFRKISLFADLGPNALFVTGGGEMENLSTSGVAFGGGFNIGIRFSKFAMSFGVDQDFTNLAKFTPDRDQKDELELEKDKYNLKTSEFHFDLRWTF